MTRITIEAELIECRVGFTARPGDRLLVWGGECFGVLPETVDGPSREPIPDVPRVSYPARKARTPSKRAERGTTLSREVLVEALAKPGTTRELTKRVSAWGHAAGRVKYLLPKLRMAGLAEPSPATIDRRFPAYQLTEAGEAFLQTVRAAAKD